MRILLVHRYFWPDSPPYAVILNEMAKMLLGHGFQVDVLSSLPSYKSIADSQDLPFKQYVESGHCVYRLPVFKDSNSRLLKLLNFVFFPLFVFGFLLFKPKYDVVTVSSAPPVVLAFCVALISRLKGFPLIYHCMDLHPEIGRLSGDFSNRLIYKILHRMELFSCRSARRIIVLSKDMKLSMISRDPGLGYKTTIINNFSLPSYEKVAELAPELKKKASVKRLIFAGNLGRFQGLEVIVRALQSFGHTDRIELLFVGEGACLEALRNMTTTSDNIHFLPHQPVSIAKQIIENADFGIVSLQPGVIRYAFPSKTTTYLECGIPLLFFVDDNYEFADFIKDNKLGYSSSMSDEKQLHAMFKKIIDEDRSILKPEELKTFYEQNFSQRMFDDKLYRLITELK